jgi:bifunctional oligoribonuclease and PAP phosphatase NrnA
MNIPADISRSIYDGIAASKKPLIVSHRNPDADTVGSNLTLRFFAEKEGKKVLSACVDEPDAGCAFLPGASSFTRNFKADTHDLIVCLDCGSAAQTGFPEKLSQMRTKGIPLLNIDHHPSNDRFGTINLIMDDSASTSLILFHLFEDWNEPITPDMATCLLAGLYFDTGSFMHSNTTGDVYATAARLMNLGADKTLIVGNLFKRQTVEKLRLLGKILDNTRLTDKRVAISAVKQEDLDSCRADLRDISGAIDMLNSVAGSRFAALLSEDGAGNVRGSLRTKNNDVNVSEIAGTLGGGGHKKASGFSVKGKLHKEVRWVIRAD